MPSVASRKAGFYYHHPQNRFWAVLTQIFQDDFLHASIATRKALLIKHQVALYDVVKRCVINGSSDASIRSVEANDIVHLIEGTSIQRIFLNGTKAYALLAKHHPELMRMAVKLPSTSLANASCSLDSLMKAWRVIRD
jgi:hypoxanthine-DNA glycosylase